MGTRHRQMVISKSGEIKIDQYGQWDGYPSGQGKDILHYLRNGNLHEYQRELEKIPLITDEQIKEVNSKRDWWQEYPYLSRDCGSDIHKMIENGEVLFVSHIGDEEANAWCEGFYTIDFQKGTFTSEFHGDFSQFSLASLPTEEEYLKAMEPEENEV